MAKIVNHEEKRASIVEVTARLIASDGMGAVTTRRIASDSGVSLGILSHYFANKDEVVVGALKWCDARFTDRLAEMYSDEFLSVADFHSLFLALLPLDEISDIEWRVRVNLITYSLTRPELKKARLESIEYAYDLATRFVERLQKEGEVRNDIEARVIGINAVDMVNGLCVNLLNFPIADRKVRVEELLEMLPRALQE